MKRILAAFKLNRACRTVARFGTAKLVVDASGRFELRGGSKAERIEAREWASLFRHEIRI